ncbi:DUF5107 domain-containing protein [Paenibacillus sacheonensis]|uniref:DUF5107 domain-containing protein n=1 Tax=Paenibacillus sacheonensis TaxID=742054 RepID=A0A7X5BZB5_9BACL|nr:DUF5107 domain-containing protein [Paenibacillus sacheonensis]MBM7568807.1 tetratricopeptide (TPR) repeat protein [Paenibacillus sacheonensis]NBC72513.1 DUF5107 domain-containing protein [Paenibacillus sacheonensis]
MKVTTATLMIEGAELEGENPLPMFRNRNPHREVSDNGSLTAERMKGMGENAGERFLPYRMQDRYSRGRSMIPLKTIVLENDALRAVFLPDYGGRLYSLRDKRADREILYKNPVFQPANLAILNAWFSGGIEWNIGHVGHTFTTCSPVHAAAMTDAEGNEFLRLYEYERCKNLCWHIDFHLPPGAEQLQIYVRIVNDNDRPVPMYWWTNIAVEETERARVFASTGDVIYIDPANQGYGFDRLPELPSVPGADVSYPQGFPYSSEYFFQTPAAERAPWEAVAYEDGRLFYERSTSRLRYRKMFCWGSHAGGRRWCDFLAKPGEGDYIEVQGGMAPTQLHDIEMPAQAVWDFTQLIGMSDMETERACQDSWETANAYVGRYIEDKLSDEQVYAVHERLQSYASAAPSTALHAGSGWGALERLRREQEEGRGMPDGFVFAETTLGPAQDPWLALLREGYVPAHPVDEAPPSWMVQAEWQRLLEASLREGAEPDRRTWTALLHHGVMLFEQGREDEAIAAWDASLAAQPSAWAYRNLAEAMRLREETDIALLYMEKAYEIANGFPDRAFAEEYLKWLIQANRFERAWRVYESLPASFAESDRIRIIVGAVALEMDNDAYMERLFETEFAVIREGEVLIIDLWYGYNAKKLARERKIGLTPRLLEEAAERFPPPRAIDFRMIGG